MPITSVSDAVIVKTGVRASDLQAWRTGRASDMGGVLSCCRVPTPYGPAPVRFLQPATCARRRCPHDEPSAEFFVDGDADLGERFPLARHVAHEHRKLAAGTAPFRLLALEAGQERTVSHALAVTDAVDAIAHFRKT